MMLPAMPWMLPVGMPSMVPVGSMLDESSWMASKTVGFRSFRMGFDGCFFTLGFGSWDVTMRSMVSSMGPAGPRRINAMDFVKA